MAANRFRGGVDHVQAFGRDRIDPPAVDIELHVLAHGSLPLGCLALDGCVSAPGLQVGVGSKPILAIAVRTERGQSLFTRLSSRRAGLPKPHCNGKAARD